MTAPQLTVYSRPGCHLCEELIEALIPLVRGRATIAVQNIDDSPSLATAYGTRIPVVELNGRELCRYHLDADAILAALARGESR